MNKLFLILLTVLMLTTVSFAHAQDSAEAAAVIVQDNEDTTEVDIVEVDTVTETEEEPKTIAPLPDKAVTLGERLKLSQEMHEIWPIRPKIERALDAISVQIDAPNRLKFKSTMRKAIDFDVLEQGSIDAMADIYTVKELGAMIAFYGSKEGRSVSYKTDDYEKALQPIMTQMVDKALLDLKVGAQSNPQANSQ